MITSAQMTFFSYFAYTDCWRTDPVALQDAVTNALNAVRDELEFDEIVWGPAAFKEPTEVFTDSLAYVVRSATKSGKPPEYTIVVRGTNPLSISSWLFQDLSVGGMTPWTRQSPNTSARNAWISHATDTSLAIHKKLTSKNMSILQWLTSAIDASPGRKITLNVTGHSLGGCMCSTLALYLHDELVTKGYKDAAQFNVYSFAGPSAGNKEFAEYSNLTLFERVACYRNPLDIAALVWVEANLESVLPDIYAPKITLAGPERTALDFFTGNVRGLGYTQPGRNVKIGSTVVDVPFNDYLLEAAYQHVIPYLVTAMIEAPIKVIEMIVVLIENLFKSAAIADMSRTARTFTASDASMFLERMKSDLRSTDSTVR